MLDPLSVVSAILTAAQLIGRAASTASQNKHKCVELAERARNLAQILPNLAHAVAYDEAAARVLQRLWDAVVEGLNLVQSCQSGGLFSGKYSSGKAAELDSVDRRINNCILDLNLISQAHRHTTTTTSVNKPTTFGSAPPPAQPRVHVHYHYRAQRGAASSAHVGWAPPPPPPPPPQHAWSAPPGYYQQPPGYGQWAPSPGPFYAASSRPFWF